MQEFQLRSPILPHIANRDFIYHYPYTGDAEYLALLPFEENAYPKNNKEELIEEAKKLVESGEWTDVLTVKELILLKRVN